MTMIERMFAWVVAAPGSGRDFLVTQSRDKLGRRQTSRRTSLVLYTMAILLAFSVMSERNARRVSIIQTASHHGVLYGGLKEALTRDIS